MIRRSCPKHGGQPQIPTEAYKMARPMGGLEAAMVAGRHGGGSWLDGGKLCRGNYEPVSKRSRFLGLGSLRDLLEMVMMVCDGFKLIVEKKCTTALDCI